MGKKGDPAWGGGRAPFGQLPYYRPSIRPWRDLGDQLKDLPLRLVGGASQKHARIVLIEMGHQLAGAGKMKAAVGQHLQEDRVCSREARAIAMRRYASASER